MSAFLSRFVLQLIYILKLGWRLKIVLRFLDLGKIIANYANSVRGCVCKNFSFVLFFPMLEAMGKM